MEDENYDEAKIEEQIKKGGAADVHSETLTAEDFRFTTHGDTLYAIAMGWPKDGEFRIRTLREGGPCQREIKGVSLLGDDKPLVFRQDSDSLKVKTPKNRPCAYAYVLKII